LVLNRNIQRYAQRKKKEPHFQTCKKIPKELKQAIVEKHMQTNIHREPYQLCSNNYGQPIKINSKSYLLRAKAYDATRNLGIY
jgi:NAD(P)H-hydrate repair Nnr-like enzyme with NAD(P)H-hydrate dehydratase domain